MEITYQAQEYTTDDTFVYAHFRISGNTASGWSILRNDKKLLQIGPGYELLQTLSCGICATDINRRFLPFELPQVTGHEVVAQRLNTSDIFAVEINDSPYARGDAELDQFCRERLQTHCPDSMVLGIDRLPGGFAPYILAPVKSIIPVHGLDENTAVLIEPFAAALQAVTASPPEDGDEVIVLGPGRLGLLLIAALAAYRSSTGIKFRIGALGRQNKNIALSRILGADFGINISHNDQPNFSKKYAIVYDTTGSTAGFETALQLAEKEVHLKSTSGLKMCGFHTLTALVVDELALLQFNKQNIHFTWPGEKRSNNAFFLSQQTADLQIEKNDISIYTGSIEDGEQTLTTDSFKKRIPRFDIAVVSSAEEIDAVVRPSAVHENSLIRPRGAILFNGDAKGNALLAFINNGGRLRTSRCGDFTYAINILKQNPKTAFLLQHNLISHIFPATELTTAFDYAANKKSLKVIIRH